MEIEQALKEADKVFWKVAHKYAYPKVLAEDLYQESRIRFILSYDSHRKECSVNSFAFIIASRACCDYLTRSRLLYGELSLTEYDFKDYKNPLEIVENKIFLENLYSHLSKKHKKILQLHLEGYTYNEICEKVGYKSKGNISRLITETINILQFTLNKQQGWKEK